MVLAAVILVVAIMVALIVHNLNNSDLRTSENDEHLAKQLEAEREEIERAFQKRFEFMYDEEHYMTIGKIALLDDGRYAGILVVPNIVSYRAVLVKDGDGWSVVGVPAVVLYYGDFPEVPEEVIRQINSLEVENAK